MYEMTVLQLFAWIAIVYGYIGVIACVIMIAWSYPSDIPGEHEGETGAQTALVFGVVLGWFPIVASIGAGCVALLLRGKNPFKDRP